MINMVYRDAFNCFDNVIVNLLESENHEYQLLYAKSWNFSYHPVMNKEECIGQKVSSHMDYAWDNLEEYHGIKVRLIDETDKGKMIEDIKKRVKIMPVITNVDTYWCSWYTSDYQKKHSLHSCLVISYDDQDNFTVQDTQMAIEGKVVSFSELYESIKGYCAIDMKEKTEIFTYKTILKQSTQHLINYNDDNSIFKQMLLFSDDIKMKLDFKKEIVGFENEPYQAAVFQAIFNIGRSRKQFSIVLDYLFNKSNNNSLSLISIKMKEIGEKWLSIFGLLSKAHYIGNEKGKKIIERVAEKINLLAMSEEKLLNEVLDIISSQNPSPVENSKKVIIKEQKYINSSIDLSSYYNCKSISTKLTNDTRAEITSERRFILGDSTLSGCELEVQNAKYIFPNIIDEDLNDNIACEGDLIEVNGVESSHIMFLGCAELGNHIENIEIEFEDGQIEQVELKFTSWLSAPAFEENLAWTGKGVERTDEEVSVYPFSISLFSNELPLNRVGHVKRIRLPLCPNIHIFAISLALAYYN